MADNISEYGFRWKRGVFSSAGSPPTRTERFAASYDPAPGGTHCGVRVGDPVIRVSDGTVAIAAAGNATYGIVAGFGPSDFSGSAVGSAWNTKYVAASAGTPGSETETLVYVIPVAGQVFEVDVDENTSITTLANYVAAFGENLDIVTAASATTGLNPRADISTHATTNTLVWRILDISQKPNLDPTGLYFKILVECNLVQQSPWTILGV